MQRTILFRGKPIMPLSSRDWVRGQFHIVSGDYYINDEKWGDVKIKPETLSQFVKRDHGVEFWEGDIYERFNYRYKVIWAGDKFVGKVFQRNHLTGWYPFEDERDRDYLLDNEDGHTKVVGTIYDNQTNNHI